MKIGRVRYLRLTFLDRSCHIVRHFGRHTENSQRQRTGGRKWPEVAGSGRKWPEVAGSGRKWPEVAISICAGSRFVHSVYNAVFCPLLYIPAYLKALDKLNHVLRPNRFVKAFIFNLAVLL